MQRESQFQAQLIRDIYKEFPGSIVLKNDPNYMQGVPDLIVLNGPHWAMLECKRSKDASHRPNQDYYIEHMAEMSYANFVYPENREEVFDDLHKAFGT